MYVRIDEAGDDPFAGQVDDPGFFRNVEAGADG